MDEQRFISGNFEECMKYVVELDSFPRKSLAVLRRCNKYLKALVDPMLTSLTVEVGDIAAFLRCGLTQRVETLSIKKSALWGEFEIPFEFLTTSMPKLREIGSLS